MKQFAFVMMTLFLSSITPTVSAKLTAPKKPHYKDIAAQMSPSPLPSTTTSPSPSASPSPSPTPIPTATPTTVSTPSLPLLSSPTPTPTQTTSTPAPTSSPTSSSQYSSGKVAALKTVGVNLAAAEFGDVPGTLNQTHTYPTCDMLKKWVGSGNTLFRYPFKIERVFNGSSLTSEVDYLRSIAECAAQNGAFIILDAHNYGRIKRDGTERIIESGELSSFWEQLSRVFKDNPGVAAYGIMNEPHDLGGVVWKDLARDAIAAIRRNDSETPLLVAGDCWSSAHTWQSCNDGMSQLKGYNILFEAHVYFDPDNSGAYTCGTAANCGVRGGLARDRLTPFLDWCGRNQVGCFIGETGVPVHDQSWNIVIDETLALLKEKGVGVTFWAAGPWWGDYLLSLERPEAQWLVERL